MTAEEQSLLLEQAKQINNSKKKTIFREFANKKYGIFVIGFLIGWVFTSLLFIAFVLA